MDLSEHFGPWKGAQNRLRKWAADGTWEKVFTAVLAQADAEGDLDWVVEVYFTITSPGSVERGPDDEPADHALGQSRGGLTTTSLLFRPPSRSERLYELRPCGAALAGDNRTV
jgi:transposase